MLTMARRPWRPRRLGPVRRKLVGAAIVAGTYAFLQLVYYAAVTYPGKYELIDDQPTPAWLWRVPLGIGVVAWLVLEVAIATAPGLRDGESQSFSSGRLASAMVPVTNVVACAIAVAVAPGPVFWAIFLGIMTTTVGVVGWAKMRP